MALMDLLKPECMKVPLEYADKQGAIGELIDLLASSHQLDDPSALKAAVWEREQIRTTGMGQGLAIPHCKATGFGNGVILAMGRPGNPMDYGSIDGRPVELIILVASPPDRTTDHIQVLAQVSRLMLNDEFRHAAYATKSVEELYSLFSAASETANANPAS